MSKKIKLDPTPAAAIVPEPTQVPRDVAAEQQNQQQIQNAFITRQRAGLAISQAEQAESERRLRQAQEATEKMLREERDLQMQTPLSAAERIRLDELEKLAMKSGNRPPETMHELAFLRERSKVSATA